MTTHTTKSLSYLDPPTPQRARDPHGRQPHLHCTACTTPDPIPRLESSTRDVQSVETAIPGMLTAQQTLLDSVHWVFPCHGGKLAIGL